MGRVAITGATGFLGSNIAEVFSQAGWEVIGLTRSEPAHALPWSHTVVDTSDTDQVSAAIDGCDALIHTAIANDFQNLDSQAAYKAYPGLTQAVTRAAVSVGAKPIYISTDWVMDGTGHRVPEEHVGRPINTYGYLKALGEQVIRDLAPETGAICRIGGVMGSHRLRADMPRNQDVGFGYFVSALVTSLQAGKRFSVFSGDGVNQIATPSLAAEIAATIHRILEKDASGVFHAVSDDAIGRFDLAQLAADVFDLDAGLIDQAPPPESERFSEPVPVDTSLGNSRLATDLGIGRVGIRDLLEALRLEGDGHLHPLTTL